jgi:O-antigen ligase
VPSIRTITAPSLSTAPQRVNRTLKAGGFALTVFVIEAALAHGVVGPEISRYVFLFVGVFVAGAVWRFPLASGLLLLGLTDFIFFPNRFEAQMGSLTIRPHEVVLTLLLVLAVAKPKRDTWGGRIGLCLLAFLLLVLASDALAVLGHHVSVTEAFNWARPLYPLTLFWVVIRLFPSADDRRVLLTGGAVIAAATGVVALFMALGAGFLQGLESGEQAIMSDGGFGSLARVRLPGLSIGYALFWYSAVQVGGRRGWSRFFWLALLAGILLDIVVSYNRNMWVGLILGLVLMGIVGGAVVRGRLIGSIAAVVAALVIFVVFGAGAGSDQIVQPILTRGSTLLNPGKTSKESSLEDRARETSIAWKTAKEHPVLGVGAGADFGVVQQHPVVSGLYIVGIRTEPQLFLHNQYLYLILIAGVPGLIAFVLFLGSTIVLAWRRRPHDPSIVALGVGLLLIMVSAIVAIYFTVIDMTAVLGLLTGVIVADSEGRALDNQPSGLRAREI